MKKIKKTIAKVTRSVPDDKDIKNFSDDVFIKFMDDQALLQHPDKDDRRDVFKSSDQDFTDEIDNFIKNEPAPRRRPSA